MTRRTRQAIRPVQKTSGPDIRPAMATFESEVRRLSCRGMRGDGREAGGG